MRYREAFLNAQRFRTFVQDFTKFDPDEREQCIKRIKWRCPQELDLFLECLSNYNEPK